MTRIRRHHVLATACSLTLAGFALAGGAVASIVPSSSFGSKGVVSFRNSGVNGVAVQPDGTSVAVGYSGKQLLVARISTHGVVHRLSAGTGVGNAVAIQPDGKIVVAGTTAPSNRTSFAGDMLLERFTPSGSPDRSFGHGGRVVLRAAVANALALGPGGTIIAAGSIPGHDGSPRVAVERLLANGSVDKSFGTGGLATIDLGPFSQANGVAVQSDGKIVFAGAEGIQDVIAPIGRLTRSGTLDHSFAQAGVYTFLHPHGGGNSTFTTVTIAGGRILAAGVEYEFSGQHALFVRLSSNGRTDGGFGSAGVFEPPAAQYGLSASFAGVQGLAVTRRGEILAAGVYLYGASSYGELWALKSSGRLDTSQGKGGALRTTVSGAAAAFSSVALDPTGKALYVGGSLVGPGKPPAFVTRFSLSGIR